MYTKFIDNDGVKYEVVTQQYESGTYVIVNGDPAAQGCSSLKEDRYHISLRIDCIKKGYKLIAGNVIPYGGKYDINKFEDVEENKKVKNN